MIFFHGTTEHAAIGILGDVEYFEHSYGEKHYLGKGIYLYTDVHQAQVWAYLKAKFQREVGEDPEAKPAVLELEINVNDDEYMDLDLREDQDIFFKLRSRYSREVLRRGKFKQYYTDSHFCDFLCQRLSVKLLAKTFPYIGNRDLPFIETRFSNQTKTHRDITRHFRTEKQYCLKENAWIDGIKLWEGSE